MLKLLKSTGEVKSLDPEALKAMIDADALGGGDLFDRVATMYGVTTWRARQIANMPRRIIDADGNEVDEDALPFEVELTDLLEQSEIALQLVGSFYWLKIKNRRGEITGVRWLSPETIKPEYNNSTGLSDFTRTIDGQQMVIPLEDMVWCWLKTGINELGPGVPPAMVDRSAASILAGINGYSGAFFANGAEPSFVIGVAGNPTPNEISKLEAHFKKRVGGGLRNFFRSIAVRDSVTVTPTGTANKDLAMEDLTNISRDDICVAHGVSYLVLDPKGGTFANGEQAKKNAITDTVAPEARTIAVHLNKKLFGLFGLKLEFLPEQLPIMQADEAERSGSLLNLVNAGFAKETAAAILGYTIPEAPPVDQRREDEIATLRRWAKKRKRPKASDFQSDILTMAEITAVLEDALGADAPFPSWEDYP